MKICIIAAIGALSLLSTASMASPCPSHDNAGWRFAGPATYSQRGDPLNITSAGAIQTVKSSSDGVWFVGSVNGGVLGAPPATPWLTPGLTLTLALNLNSTEAYGEPRICKPLFRLGETCWTGSLSLVPASLRCMSPLLTRTTFGPAVVGPPRRSKALISTH